MGVGARKVQLIAAALVLGVGACAGHADSESTDSSEARLAPKPGASTSSGLTQSVVVDQLVPSDVPLEELAIIGGTVDVGPRSKVVTRFGKYAAVGGVGPNGVTLQTDSDSGSIHSAGEVALHTRSHVHGAIRASGSVRRQGNGAIVDGTVSERQAVPVRHLIRRATFDVRSAAVDVKPGATLTTPILPGFYDSVRLGPRSSATLVAGNYYFDDVAIGTNAKLTIDDSDGAVFVYVGRSFDFGGDVTTPDAHFPRWLVSYVGSGTARIRSAFRGGVMAPSGAIRLDGPGETRHEGTFFGKEVRVGPDSIVVRHEPPSLIRKVTFDRAQVCAGETVRISVDAEELDSPGTAARITIDGMPVGSIYDQVEGAAGKQVYAVSATGRDGSKESLLTSVKVVACSPQAPKAPRLFGQENGFHRDTLDFTVVNAKDFADGTESYVWDFGDGATQSGSAAAVSHDYGPALPVDVLHKPFDVTVTVKRPGIPDAVTKRTFVVWNAYAQALARGSLEPPTAPADPILVSTGPDFVGRVDFSNREPEVLTYERRRIDQIPCDGDAAPTVGGTETAAIVVPARGSTTQELRLPRQAVSASTCGVSVHYWGKTASGRKAEASVYFERPSPLGSGQRASPEMENLLNYIVSKNLAADPKRIREEELVRLYRERKLRFDLATGTYFQGQPEVSRDECNPDDLNDPARPNRGGPGFSCQPTGKWEGTGPGESPLEEHIQNALKGDSVLVRGCAGAVGPLVGAVDPPQAYTHIGIMTKHRFEIRQSTGDEDFLFQNPHPSGTADQPTNGFVESALRYGWPGTVTVSVSEGFVHGREAISPPTRVSPEGRNPKDRNYRIKGFQRDPVRCPGDAMVTFQRVIKPAPEFEASVRGKLMAAADASKSIHGHYRFHDYSDARTSMDPGGPAPFTSPIERPLETYGPSRTVCSSFVRSALLAGGFELDRDKAFPRPSDLGQDTLPPDGLFFYGASERKRGAQILYKFLNDLVRHNLATAAAAADDYWWMGAASLPVTATVFGPFGAAVTGVGTASIFNVDSALVFATDAPDDIASQVTNCFASDFCSIDAKNSSAWEEPGTGVAVSPDNILDHYDSPATGGPYGYSELMVYRGLDYRQRFEWRPSHGTLALSVQVRALDQSPVPQAGVTVPGVVNEPRVTDSEGRTLIEGVPRGNIIVHAQKFYPTPAPGELREADACFKPERLEDPNSQVLLRVNCQNFDEVLETNVTQPLVILQPPREDFRQVTVSGVVRVKDCDCFNADDIDDRSIFGVCRLSPLQREAEFGHPTQALCVDEVGVDFKVKCKLAADNRTVHILIEHKLYEDVSGSCGADDLEDGRSFVIDVPAGQTATPTIPNLSSTPDCCSDGATFRDIRIENRRAD